MSLNNVILILVGKENALDFLNGVSVEISLYIGGSTQPLKDAVLNSNKPYMTQSVKDKIVELLTY